MYRRCATLFQNCFNVRHWRCINVMERWKSDDVDPQRWNNVDPTLKCWLGWISLKENHWTKQRKIRPRFIYSVIKFSLLRHGWWGLFLDRILTRNKDRHSRAGRVIENVFGILATSIFPKANSSNSWEWRKFHFGVLSSSQLP